METINKGNESFVHYKMKYHILTQYDIQLHF